MTTLSTDIYESFLDIAFKLMGWFDVKEHIEDQMGHRSCIAALRVHLLIICYK